MKNGEVPDNQGDIILYYARLQKVAGFAYVTRWAHLAEPKADGGTVAVTKMNISDEPS